MLDILGLVVSIKIFTHSPTIRFILKSQTKVMPKTKQINPDMTASQRRKYRVDYVKNCKKAAEEATKTWRKQREELWNLFQNRQDYTKKEDWQSNCFVPKIFIRVVRAAALIKRALLQTQKLFKFEANVDDINERLDELQDILSDVEIPLEAKVDVGQQIAALKKQRDRVQKQVAQLEKRFKRAVGDTNLVNIYAEMATGALLLGLGDPKVLWENDAATFENVDVLNLFIVPQHLPFTGKRPFYLVEYKNMRLAELRKMAKEVNEGSGKQLFAMKEIKKIKEEYEKLDTKAKERARKGLDDYTQPSSFKPVELLEFWGDVISDDGKEIEENRVLMVANGKYLIYNNPNPFKHKKPPHNLTYPMPYPHRGTAGVSIAEPIVKLQYAYNNIFNMYIDNLNFSVNKIFEYDPNKLRHPTDILTVYPGKTIPTKGGESQVVKEVITKAVSTEATRALEVAGREIDEGTSVTEFVQGMPGRKAKTLGEVQIKTAEAHSLFDVIARDMEQNSLKPLLEMTYDLYVQFADYPAREDLFTIKVGGISLLLAQEEQINNIGKAIGMAVQVPVLAQMTDLDDLWKKYLSVHNLSDAYKEPESAQGQLAPQQMAQIEGQAQVQVQEKVAQMSPEEIMNAPVTEEVGAEAKL